MRSPAHGIKKKKRLLHCNKSYNFLIWYTRPSFNNLLPGLVYLTNMSRTTDCRPYEFIFDNYVTGHHVYKEVWDPFLGEELRCLREPENLHDTNAIKIMRCEDDDVIGHVPKRFTRACSYVLLGGGSIVAMVIGPRENNRNNGLEVPVTYRVKGPREKMLTAEALIKGRL